MLQDSLLSPTRQAHIYAAGFLTILTLGTLATIALCLASIWFLVELAQLLLAAIVESCSTIAATYTAADPLVRFLMLVAIGYLIYSVGRRAIARR